MINFDKDVYYYSFIKENGVKTVFKVNFLSGDQLKQREAYAKACYNELNLKRAGTHSVDYYSSMLAYLKSESINPDEGEWSWSGLDPFHYKIYERRMEYDAASEDRKMEMLEEKAKFRRELMGNNIDMGRGEGGL